LAKVALEAQALRDLECRDDGALDLVVSLASSTEDKPIFPARLVQVRGEFVVLARP
jgi:hypothetical protein